MLGFFGLLAVANDARALVLAAFGAGAFSLAAAARLFVLGFSVLAFTVLATFGRGPFAFLAVASDARALVLAAFGAGDFGLAVLDRAFVLDF
jgi:hypothetical protein